MAVRSTSRLQMGTKGSEQQFSYQFHGKKKRYHQRESEYWLNFSEVLLDERFDEFKVMVFEKLDSIVKASSLVEMVNSLIRLYLTHRSRIFLKVFEIL